MNLNWFGDNNNNNINNYKTSIAPISSKRIELSGTSSTEIGQIRSLGTMQGSATSDQVEWKLRKDKQACKGEISNDDRKKLRYFMT